MRLSHGNLIHTSAIEGRRDPLTGRQVRYITERPDRAKPDPPPPPSATRHGVGIA